MTREEKIKFLIAIRENRVSMNDIIGKPVIRHWRHVPNGPKNDLWEWNGHQSSSGKIGFVPGPPGGCLNILSMKPIIEIEDDPDLFEDGTGKDFERYEGPYNYWPIPNT
jgi:hypothetical protein